MAHGLKYHGLKYLDEASADRAVHSFARIRGLRVHL
jgi:hypothetical protein